MSAVTLMLPPSPLENVSSPSAEHLAGPSCPLKASHQGGVPIYCIIFSPKSFCFGCPGATMLKTS